MVTTGPNIVLFLLGGGLLYLALRTIYRLTLHPLAKYPGPLLAKVTRFYHVYHAYKKDLYLDQYQCHKKYGSVVRYAPNYLIFNTEQALRDIYTGPKSSPVQKAEFYTYLHDESGATSSHGAIDKDEHAFKRRVLSHGFSEQALRDLEEFMVVNINKWTELLGRDSSTENNGWSAEPKDVALWTTYLTFDVLGDLCFGKPFGLLDDPSQRYIPNLMLQRLWQSNVVGSSGYIPLYRWMQFKTPLERWLMPEGTRKTAAFRALAGKSIKERLAQGSDPEKSVATVRGRDGGAEKPRKDFVHYLTTSLDAQTGRGYTPAEFVMESRLLVAAGSDTSSVALAAAFYYLTRHPDIQARLRQELRDKFTSVDQITSGPTLSSCHYLRATIDETLRITPPIPSAMMREITAPGLLIDSHPLRPGTQVGVPIYAIHHNELYFPHPHIFDPSRWLSSTATSRPETLDAARRAFCPFSLGSRGCTGKTMAYNELSIALGRVCWLYEFRRSERDDTPCDGPWGEYATRDAFLSEREGPLVEFRRIESK